MTHTVVQILGHGTLADLTQLDRTDGQLLDLFVRKHDQEAFAAVVRRHGAMVLAVCRRVLRNAADADDAFQAAFLVLARKAGALGCRGALAPWLHGVAFNTARKLRYANARRAGRERPLAEAPEPPAAGCSEPHAELLAILDEELNRLPDRYREPIVLCDLEGATRREAARVLGCPEGTVAGRLARARALLATRLKGRGLTLPGGLLAAVLGQSSASAFQLVPVVVQTVAGPVSPRIANLTERVIHAMLARKLKAVALAMVLCGFALAGLASLFQPAASADPGAPPDKPLAKAPPEAKPEKVFTHVPLKGLNPTETATALQRVLPERITVAPVRDENAIIIYATEADTKDVLKALLVGVQDPNLPKPPKLYTFSFRNTRWADVLEWYEKESGLTNVSKSTPKGEVTLVPPGNKKVTFGEITDLFNEALMQQMFILVRSDTTFFLHPADEKIDLGRVPSIKVSELPNRGRTELVQVTIVMKYLHADTIEPEVKKLLSRFGVAMALPKTHTIQVLDTAGNVQRILDLINLIDKPKAGPDGLDPGMFPRPRLIDPLSNEPEGHSYRVKAGTARVIADALRTTGAAHKVVVLLAGRDEIMVHATPEQHAALSAHWGRVGFDPKNQTITLYIPLPASDPAEVATKLGKVFRTPDAGGPSFEVITGKYPGLVVTGTGDQIGDVAKSLASVRTPHAAKTDPQQGAAPSEPEIRKYAVPAGTADAVAKLLVAVDPQLKVIPFPPTNEIIVLASPADHAKLKERMSWMKATPETATIPVLLTDPADIVAKLLKLFPSPNVGGATIEVLNDGKPGIVVKGTKAQIDEIRKTIQEIEGAGKQPRPMGELVKPAPKKFSLNMKDVPWGDVLEWYAKESGLTPIYGVKPTGKFSFVPPTPDTQYTLTEVTDILNESMAAQKFMLVRLKESFTILPTDEKLDLHTLRRVELADLPDCGKTEIVQVLIPLKDLEVKDVAPEVQKMLTPFGAVSMLSKTNALVIVDTAGNVQRIVDTLRAVESFKADPNGADPQNPTPKKDAAPEGMEEMRVSPADSAHMVSVLAKLYPLSSFGTPPVEVNVRDNRLIVIKATKAQLVEVRKALQQVGGAALPGKTDRSPAPRTGPNDVDPGMLPRPQLSDPRTTASARDVRKYSVPAGTGEAVAKALAADNAKLKVVAVPGVDVVLVLASEAEHAGIEAKIKELSATKLPEPKK